jgi:ABC-type sulfate transport system permease component
LIMHNAIAAALLVAAASTASLPIALPCLVAGLAILTINRSR